MGTKRKQEREEIEFDEEEEAPAYVPPITIGHHYKQRITPKILTQEARALALKTFGLSLPGNPYIELNRIFSLKNPKNLDDHDRMLYERKENPVNREIIGKNLLLWNYIYRFLKEDELFVNGRMDDAFSTKMSLLELKVTFQHNPSYPEYEHGVSLGDCRVLADFIGKPISKEQVAYGILFKRGNKHPHIPFNEFNRILERNFVQEHDITKWNIFGPNILKGHPLEHADPKVHCLATMVVPASYKSMKVILADERWRLYSKITRNDVDKRYEVMSYAKMAKTLIGELYGQYLVKPAQST